MWSVGRIVNNGVHERKGDTVNEVTIVCGLLSVMCLGLWIACYKLLIYNAEYRQELNREKNDYRREYEKAGRLESELREVKNRNLELQQKLTKITAVVTGVPSEQGFDSGYGLLKNAKKCISEVLDAYQQ